VPFFHQLNREYLHTQLDLQENTSSFIKENIVPLNNKHVPPFSAVFRETVIE
jgi:hypothetical protein